MVADKIKTLLNFKNDFNLTNSTVQIQIIFMNKDNKTQSEGKLDNSTYKNKTFTNNTNPLQNNNFTPTQVRYRDTYRPAIGINEITKKNILKLYPNPSSNEINIDFKEISSGIISISDMYGREIFNQKISYLDKFKLATSSFISGIYYVKYTNTNGNSFVSSFIKLND